MPVATTTRSAVSIAGRLATPSRARAHLISVAGALAPPPHPYFRRTLSKAASIPARSASNLSFGPPDSAIVIRSSSTHRATA